MAQNIRVQIRRVKKGLAEGISAQVGEIAFSSFSTIVFASPVLTGAFRNDWQVSLGRPSTVTKTGTDKSGAKTVNEAKAFFANYQLGKDGEASKIFFANNKPYAVRLNAGHSAQARPAGFVQRALRAGLNTTGAQGKIFKS